MKSNLSTVFLKWEGTNNQVNFYNSGIGAGLFWLFSQRITADISSIGSPSTNVTIDLKNTNNPTIRQTLSNTNTAINTNNDGDTIRQTVTNSNVNNGWLILFNYVISSVNKYSPSDTLSLSPSHFVAQFLYERHL